MDARRYKGTRMKICIGKDIRGWDHKFAAACQALIEKGAPISFELVDLDQANWLAAVEGFEGVIWNPGYWGMKQASHFKEKIYFIENILNLKVMPNYQTVWAFDSKAAEGYIFQHYKVPTPPTTVSFSYEDALQQLEQARLPLIVKNTEGAAATGVRMVRSKKKYRHELEYNFAQQRWEVDRRTGNKWDVFRKNFFNKWSWLRLVQRLRLFKSPTGLAYWQQFIPDNPGDLRIAVVGNYAYGFWRQNRKNDFRASGSGIIDFERALPEHVVTYLIEFSNRLGFDAMVYDILFDRDSFYIVEMSYNCPDKNLYKQNYVYQYSEGTLTKIPGHFWIQALWVEHFVEKYGGSVEHS
jgi:glutathione synthase/RimK-type ligase-like ATP-grasp enzyme